MVIYVMPNPPGDARYALAWAPQPWDEVRGQICEEFRTAGLGVVSDIWEDEPLTPADIIARSLPVELAIVAGMPMYTVKYFKPLIRRADEAVAMPDGHTVRT